MDEDEESPRSVEERKSPSPVEPYNPESPQAGLSLEKKLQSESDESPSLSFPPGLGDFSSFSLPPLPNFLGSNLFPFLPPPPPIYCNNNNNSFTERFPNKHNGGVRPDHLLYLTGGNSPLQNNRPPHRNHNNKRRGPYNADRTYNGNRAYNRPSNHNSGKNEGASYNLDLPTSKLILVRNVPPEMNKMDLLDSHFSKFGKINSIEIGTQNDLGAALIEFANPYDARKAHRSIEAVFNNRFIRVYWGANRNFKIQQEMMGSNGNMKNNSSSNRTSQTNGLPLHRAQPSFTALSQNEPSSSVSYQPSPNLQLPTISIGNIEREILRNEVKEEQQKLNEAMTNKNLLLKKISNAKTPSEKTAIKGLLKCTMENAETLQKSLKSKLDRLSSVQRTVKVYSKDQKMTLPPLPQRWSLSPSLASNYSAGHEGGDGSHSRNMTSNEEEEMDENYLLGIEDENEDNDDDEDEDDEDDNIRSRFR